MEGVGGREGGRNDGEEVKERETSKKREMAGCRISSLEFNDQGFVNIYKHF